MERQRLSRLIRRNPGDVQPGDVLPGDVPPRIAALELHPWELLSGRRHFAIMAVILAGVLFAVSDFVWIF